MGGDQGQLDRACQVAVVKTVSLYVTWDGVAGFEDRRIVTS